MALIVGNPLINLAAGTPFADQIFGLGGSDTLLGGDGDDYMRGDNLATGAPAPFPNVPGNDWMDGGNGNDRMFGDAGDDTMFGGNGNDYLDGGTGADNMNGGAGDDVYVVDSVADVTTEGFGGGIDTIVSSVNRTLGANFENLTLTGAATSGVGNSQDNILQGNALGNFLSGQAGNDTLYGWGGNDLLLGDSGNDSLYGGDGDDNLNGGSEADLLVGGMGRDIQTGGTGNDVFRFLSVAESPAGAMRDVITDFNGLGFAPGDRIDLSAIDANLALPGDQAFAAAQISYVGGILRADVLFGADLEIQLAGAPGVVIGGVFSDIVM
jgi:Ca2+-binding RTX toxin-like protein